MQTFLPYPDARRSAAVLDRARLGKQRVEVLQILRTLAGETDGWRNHPAVLMWADSPQALAYYGLEVCGEWRRRGYRDTCMEKIVVLSRAFGLDEDPPAWWGDERLHSSHRAALLFKDPGHYGAFGWREAPAIPDNKGRLPYWWPTKGGGDA